MNSLRMICSTFIDWFAQSMRFLPMSANSMIFTSHRTCVGVVDIPLLIDDAFKIQIFVSSFAVQNTRMPGGKAWLQSSPELPERVLRPRRLGITNFLLSAKPVPVVPHRWPVSPLCRSLPK